MRDECKIIGSLFSFVRTGIEFHVVFSTTTIGLSRCIHPSTAQRKGAFDARPNFVPEILLIAFWHDDVYSSLNMRLTIPVFDDVHRRNNGCIHVQIKEQRDHSFNSNRFTADPKFYHLKRYAEFSRPTHSSDTPSRAMRVGVHLLLDRDTSC